MRARAGHVHGGAAPGFGPVADAFRENFESRHELGAAVCVHFRGEKVVDFWGGIRERATGASWHEDTMVLVHSATKGFSAMTLALAHSRGWLDYDERVCTYWPEFAANGKGDITVRQLLAHQAGLFAFDDKVDRDLVADSDRLAKVLARQKPAWPAGSRQSYHALSLGFYQGELMRRVDPAHRSLGRIFQEEIATPLELDFYIRLPETIPNGRLAILQQASMFRMLFSMPFPLMLAAFNKNSDIYRSLLSNPGAGICLDPATIYARNLEVPSGGGVGTARAMARAYSVFATGGRELGLRTETLSELMAPPRPSANGFFDDGIRDEARYSLGFMRPAPGWEIGSPGAFGAPGAGGSLAFADPEKGLAYAYVTNKMSARMLVSARDIALRQALAKCVKG